LYIFALPGLSPCPLYTSDFKFAIYLSIPNFIL
jgi:hypothetical protein